jgi:hypothetical protein
VFSGFGADVDLDDDLFKDDPTPVPAAVVPQNMPLLTNSFGAISFAPTNQGSSSFTSSMTAPSKGKKILGAKKASKVNFEEAEKRANDEALLMKAADEERLRLQSLRPIISKKNSYTSRPVENTRNTSVTSRPEPVPQPKKFGFGFDPSEAPQESAQPKQTYKGPKGFGNEPIGGIPDEVPNAATTRFSSSKGISSDQYFNREDRDQNQASTSNRNSYNGDGTITKTMSIGASEFATQFSSQAQEDFDSVKRFVSTGGAKLSDLLADIQVFFKD